MTAEELEEDWSGPLPDAVRQRVVALASDALAGLSDDEVPGSLRPFYRWAPARRTKLAATPLAAAVEHDVFFRQRVAATVAQSSPDLVAALEAGTTPAAADPVEVAAVAFVARTAGWPALVSAAAAHIDQARAEAESVQSAQDASRLLQELETAGDKARVEAARLREDLSAARAEAEALGRALREEKGARRRAEREAAENADAAAEAKSRADGAAATAEAEARRLRTRLSEAEAAVEAARTAVREGRGLEDARLRLLLDTVVEAAAGLRRELALPPTELRPGDLVAGATPGGKAAGGDRGLAVDDPAGLDQLLALPQVHVIVDGYNVTKTGYPDLSLERQRTRLVGGLTALAARTGAEVTCCFDGATVQGRVPSMTGRGVRVLFSKPGEIADELIRRLVAAEPQGRPVVVVSSDREVADGIRRLGARAVSSAALVRRLDRG